MGKKSTKNTLVLGNFGPPCPRCKQGPTQVREHRTVTEKLLKQRYFYSRWFRCMNRHCVTTQFQFDEYKVYPHSDDSWKRVPLEEPVKQRLAAIADQLGEKLPWDD